MNDLIPVNKEPDKKSWQYIVWNIFFSLMYPFLVAFALIVTGIVSFMSHTFNAVYYVVNFFRKKN
ncbi:MAG TPA: hypothetical protein VL947_05095 [Cytophagales bacterium]|nr:hypothetical protein [Cytophagales bacterium]